MSATKSKAPLQLFALTADGSKYHYGEFSDDHLLAGSPRKLYTRHMKLMPITDEWKAYLMDRRIELELPSGKWQRLHIKHCNSMLVHDSGYVMPLLKLGDTSLIAKYPCIELASPSPVMPKQTIRPPPILAKADSRMKDDDADSHGCVVGDEDSDNEGKKERDALRAAVKSMKSVKFI